MRKVVLEFGDVGKEIAKSLSAFVYAGGSIFAGGDEGVKLARLEERDDGQRFELEELLDLSKWFDLPRPSPGPDEKGEGDRSRGSCDRSREECHVAGRLAQLPHFV